MNVVEENNLLDEGVRNKTDVVWILLCIYLIKLDWERGYL